MAEMISNIALVIGMVAVCAMSIFFVKATNKMFNNPNAKKKA